MEIRDMLATVYIGRPNQINISVTLSRVMGKAGWKNREEAFAYFDEKTGRIIITRNYEEARKMIRRAPGEIWNGDIKSVLRGKPYITHVDRPLHVSPCNEVDEHNTDVVGPLPY